MAELDYPDEGPVARITVRPQEPVVDWREMGALADLSGAVRGPYEGWAPSPLQVASGKTFGDYLSELPMPEPERDRLLPPPSQEGSTVPEAAGKFFAPHLTDPRTYQPLPPPANLPETGKVPQTAYDPRIMGSVADFANLGTLLAGGPEAALASKGAAIIAGIGAGARRLPRIGAPMGKIAEMPGVSALDRGALTGEVLPPAPVASGKLLAGISAGQRAKLGPMVAQLEKFGATPEQLATFTPQEAYDFIKARNLPQPIRRTVDYRDPSGRPTQTAPLPIGSERNILEKGADLAENPPLYHVAGPEYQAGDPLRSLYSRKGNEAYDVFAQRWPDAGDLALHHPHNTYFYKTPAEAAAHAENFGGGGTVLRVDPRQVEGLRFDPTEAPGYLATRYDVPPEALSPHEQPPLMQAAERKGPMGEAAAQNVRTDLPTPAYHGTNKVFPAFENQPVDYMLDRSIGTHAAKDPALASTFADRWIKAKDAYDPAWRTSGAGEFRIEGNPHVIPLRIPAEEKFLQVVQPPHRPPAEAAALGVPEWRNVMHDEYAVERMAAVAAFKRDPDLLARYLYEARNIPPEVARPVSRALVAGEIRPIKGKPLDLQRLVSNFGGKPYNELDRARMVDLARQQWQGEGYSGLRYINTAPKEAGGPGVRDPTSYIVFDPKNIRSKFARFDPAKMNSSDLLAGLAAAGAVPLGMLARQDQYQQ